MRVILGVKGVNLFFTDIVHFLGRVLIVKYLIEKDFSHSS